MVWDYQVWLKWKFCLGEKWVLMSLQFFLLCGLISEIWLICGWVICCRVVRLVCLSILGFFVQFFILCGLILMVINQFFFMVGLQLLGLVGFIEWMLMLKLLLQQKVFDLGLQFLWLVGVRLQELLLWCSRLMLISVLQIVVLFFVGLGLEKLLESVIGNVLNRVELVQVGLLKLCLVSRWVIFLLDGVEFEQVVRNSGRVVMRLCRMCVGMGMFFVYWCSWIGCVVNFSGCGIMGVYLI